jgi:predicted glycosyltransferase
MEMFPFGRRKFAYELVPCLEQIERQGRRTAVVSSVRDILVSKRDQARHEDSACTLLNRHFDLVLVHSDPRFQRLEETFLRTRDIACPIAYTGFVKEETVSPVLPPRSGVPRVIASIGGGRVGDHLLLSVIRASRLLQTDLRHELQVFAGPYMDADDFRELQRAAADAAHIRITRFASDFVNQMAAADLSLSMAGYNTCMNILTTGTRAMVFPFSGNGNEEQTVRARKLAALGLLDVLDDQMLGPLALACRMKKALTSPGKAGPVKLDLNGVSNTVRLLQSALKRTAWCV